MNPVLAGGARRAAARRRAERVAEQARSASVSIGSEQAEIVIEHRAGRGRCCVAASRIEALSVVRELSSEPWAACLLHGERSRRCEHCFGPLLQASTRTATAPRGSPATYCSATCRDADHKRWPHEQTLAGRGAGPLARQAVLSASLAADEDCESLDRFGTLLLAARCLWRRSVAADGVDERLFDGLSTRPPAAGDLELGAMAAAISGFLPPGVCGSPARARGACGRRARRDGVRRTVRSRRCDGLWRGGYDWQAARQPRMFHR